MIRATSPRETIPEPIIAEDFVPNPVIRAPSPQPISFVNTAITVKAKMNKILSPMPSNVILIPILTKNTGTNIV